MALIGSGGSRNNKNGEGRNQTEKSLGQLRKGPWTGEEDRILKEHVRVHGEGNWGTCQTVSGLMRCGKSCRLRWLNHLRPNLKKGTFSATEEAKIADLHDIYGPKWSFIARQLPGRTDNEIKNYWYTRVKRSLRARVPIYPSGATTHQAQNMMSSLVPPIVPSPEQVQNPTDTPYISIYDIFKTSSRKTIAFSSYNGLSYEQIGAANGQMHEVYSAELFSPMIAQTSFENIGAGDYETPIGAAVSHANIGILGNREGVVTFTDDATGGSLIHSTIDAAWPRESDQADDDFQSRLGTPLAMSMNDWFDKDGTIFP